MKQLAEEIRTTKTCANMKKETMKVIQGESLKQMFM